MVNYTLATRAVQADISLMTILLILALGTVFVILCLGLFTLVKGGEISRQWSNRLMRYRALGLIDDSLMPSLVDETR